MTLKQIRVADFARDRYFQAGAARRLYISHPIEACRAFTVFGRPIKTCYQLDLVIKPAFLDNLFTKESLRKVAEYYYGRQTADRNFLKKLMNYWQVARVKPFFDFNRRLDQTNLRALTNPAFLKLFRDYSDVYLRLWREAIFLDAYDYYGEIMLKSAQKRVIRSLSDRELVILLTPPRLSFPQQERLAILDLAERIKRQSRARRRTIWHQPEVLAALEKLSRDFHWLMNDLTGAEYLGPDYFKGQVQELLNRRAKLKAEQAMRRDMASLTIRKRQLFKKYSSESEFLNLGDYLARLGNFRDERKSYNQMANARLIRLAAEFNRRYAWSPGTAEQLFFWELSALPHRRTALAALARRRKQRAVLYHLTSDKKFRESFDAQAKSFVRRLKIQSAKITGLQGQPAYAGLVRGLAKIIRNKEDFSKLRPGEILIAPNTRPEYIPIMKIAGAIVSEEGGITCHAAITSRELHVPCLVGVSGVTEIIKDGDFIEVDARAGRLNVIKKKLSIRR